MENMPSAGAETRTGYWKRTLRPLLWWGILVLLLFAVHQHQLAMERTRLYCSVTMYETNVLYDAVGTLDGHQISSGDKISLGSHQFTITEPKAESFSTNFFAWYGRHDFGKINLKRGMGTLNVTAEPAARVIAITGPEFAMTLQNSTGTNVLVPTDTYRVNARFARCSVDRDYQVTTGNTTPFILAPQLGAVRVTCNELPTTFELEDANGNPVESGDMPAVVTQVPAGKYFIAVAYHNHALKQEIAVSAKETNDVPFHFAFGAARFESTPPGAQVYTTNGTFLGITPVVVTELPPSTADYRLQLNGYDGATVSVTVAEDQTNAASATLVSLSYLGSMRTAKEDMAAGHYRNALNSAEQALVAKPGDADALNLQATAKGREMVEEAKALAGRSDYGAAGKKLEAALEILPNDAEVTNLQAGYKVREAEQQKLDADRQKAELDRQRADAEAKERVERTKRPHDYFVKLMADTPNSSDFVEQELKVNGDAGDLRAKIADALSKGVLLKFTIEQNEETFPGGFFILAKLSEMDGFRRCYIVGGQTADGEVTIRFKVLEYTWPPDLALSALLKKPGDDQAIPIGHSNLSPSIKESRQALGMRMVRERIEHAIMENGAH
jgi:tetratricopeptide (TPR) repeat protein